MRFFVDNCLSTKIARALDAVSQPDHRFHHLREMFPPNVADEEWITALAEEGNWAVITGDMGIVRKPQLKRIWESSGLVGFFLKGGWTNMDPDTQHSRLALLRPHIIAVALNCPRQATFSIGKRARTVSEIIRIR